MKDKYAVTAAALAAIAMLVSCGGDASFTSDDQEVLIAEIFNAGMAAYSASMSSVDCLDCTRGKSRETVQINESIDEYMYSSEGGYIHTLGSITGQMTLDDVTGECLSLYLSIGMTASVVNYKFTSDDRTFTMNGAPNISYAGTFTMLEPCITFATASEIVIGGALQIVGPDFDEIYDIHLTVLINETGTGGHVSGYIGDTSIDYTF